MQYVGVYLFLISILPFLDTHAVYGDTGAWCWIKNDYYGWRFIQFYGILWAAIGYNSYVYYKVYEKLKASSNKENEMVSRIKFYPLVLVCCWTFATIDTIAEIFTTTPLWLQGLHIFLATSQGLGNAIYGLTEKVKNRP